MGGGREPVCSQAEEELSQGSPGAPRASQASGSSLWFCIPKVPMNRVGKLRHRATPCVAELNVLTPRKSLGAQPSEVTLRGDPLRSPLPPVWVLAVLGTVAAPAVGGGHWEQTSDKWALAEMQ